MSKKPLILGIETSCDETAASLITENPMLGLGLGWGHGCLNVENNPR